MKTIQALFQQFSKFIRQNQIDLLRISIGIVFFWFGLIKFFYHSGPAESIAAKSILLVTFDLLKSNVSLPILATIECIIGLGFLFKRYMKYVIPIMYFQMAATLVPLFVFPEDTWEIVPFVPTLLGHYIIKNTVLISAAIILYTISKGGKLIADPAVAQKAKAVEKKVEKKKEEEEEVAHHS